MVKENDHGFLGIDNVLCLDQGSIFIGVFICKKYTELYISDMFTSLYV